MATTTNYGWVTPDDTDLVKDGAAAIRTLGSSADTTTKNLNPETTLGDLSFRSATSNVNTRIPIGSSGQHLTVVAGVPAWSTASDQTPLTTKGDLFTFSTVDARLAVGTNGQVLTADSNEPTGLKFATPADQTPLTTKGDLFTFSTVDARLAVGTNGQVLTADSSEATGLKFATPAGGGKVLQVVNAVTTTSTTIASTSFADTTITATITPTLATSKVLILVNPNAYVDRSDNEVETFGRLLRTSTDIYTSELYRIRTNGGNVGLNVAGFVMVLDAPATTSATTYKLQGRVGATSNSGQVIFQRGTTSSITLLEIGA